MQDVLNIVLLNLEKVGVGLGLFLGAYLANMGLGAWRNVKIEGWTFDYKLIIQSILKFLVLGISIGLLSIVTSFIPSYASYVGIEIPNATLETMNSLVIVGAFLSATIHYGLDAIYKVKEIFGVNKEE